MTGVTGVTEQAGVANWTVIVNLAGVANSSPGMDNQMEPDGRPRRAATNLHCLIASGGYFSSRLTTSSLSR